MVTHRETSSLEVEGAVVGYWPASCSVRLLPRSLSYETLAHNSHKLIRCLPEGIGRVALLEDASRNGSQEHRMAKTPR